MRTIINFIKRLPRLYRNKKFNYFINKKSPRLSEKQVEELIEANEDTFSNLGDNLDYDGMGNWGRFPPQNSGKK